MSTAARSCGLMSTDRRPRGLVPARYRAVLGRSRYRRFAIGEVASAVGDGIGLTAVPWIALTLAPPGLTWEHDRVWLVSSMSPLTDRGYGP
jgi:hypothetical protein